MTTNVADTLKERGNRYGEFDEHSRITQNIKRAMADSRNWDTLDDDMKEALEMLAHKVGRILNGDPSYTDSWHDIGGYVKLVEDRLVKEQDAEIKREQPAIGTANPVVERRIPNVQKDLLSGSAKPFIGYGRN